MYNPLYLKIDHSTFKVCDQSEFYTDAKEAISVDAPEPQQREVDIHMFVDSNHEGGITLLEVVLLKHRISAVFLNETVYSGDISNWC